MLEQRVRVRRQSCPCNSFSRLLELRHISRSSTIIWTRFSSCSVISTNSKGLGQGWNRVLVSLISWPGQLLSLNPCRRPKILARMLFFGDFVFNSSNSWHYTIFDYRLWLLVKTTKCIRNIIFEWWKEIYGKHHLKSFEGGWAGKFTFNFVMVKKY